MNNHQNNDWYKMDNVANVFLASFNKRDTRCMRVSATLTEEINPELLQKAVDITMKTQQQFQVRIRRGFFWHYLEPTNIAPKVVPEEGRPCPLLYGNRYQGFLHFKVSFYQNRINIDMFHALGDGTGALGLLHLVVGNYLKLVHKNEIDDILPHAKGSKADRIRNSYEQFYGDKEGAIPKTILNKKKKAYHIQSRKLPYDQLQFFEIHTSASVLKKKAKELSVGMSAYIGARLMIAINEDRSLVHRSKPITISVPVNLRNYYPSDTMRNFFNSVDISHVFTNDDTLESLALEFDTKLKEALVPENIQNQMNRYESMERLFFTRVVPLRIKQAVIRCFAKKEAKTVTAVLSNLGKVEVPESQKKYIKGISDYCSTDKLFITMTSYGDDMCFGIASAYSGTSVLRNLIDGLQKDGANITLYASEVVY